MSEDTITTASPETDTIEGLTIGELRDLFISFLDAAKVATPVAHRQRIWDAFEAELLKVATVKPGA